MFDSIGSFIKKHNERVTIVGLGLGLFFFIGSGLYLQKNKSQENAVVPEKAPVKVELQVKQGDATGKDSVKGKKIKSFFLQPSPTELLEMLSDMENLQEDVAQSKLQHLRVLWPVYYFSMESLEGGDTITLDISENGFGIAVKGNINSAEYPRLKDVKAGDKMWVAGEIGAVDLSGTGTVYLNIELLDFTKDGPPAAIAEPPVASK